MKERSTKILLDLVSSSRSSFLLQQLAEKYDISMRTLRNDIAEINDMLNDIGQPPLIHNDKGVYSLSPEADIEKIRCQLENLGSYLYKLSASERQQIILEKLLSTTDPTPAQELAQLLYVTRMTITNDISMIREGLKPLPVTLKSLPRKGFLLTADERDARNILYEILHRHITDLNNLNAFDNMLLDELICEFTLQKICTAVNEAMECSGEHMNPSQYQKVVLYTFIAANRVSLEFELPKCEPFEPETEIEERSHRFTAVLMRKIGIKNDSEIHTLSLWLMKSQIITEHLQTNDVDMYTLVARFISLVFRKLKIDLTCDYITFTFLNSHLARAIERLRSGNVEGSQDFEEEIHTKYNDVYNAVQENIFLFEHYFHCTFTYSEIIYVVLHVCAAIERHTADFDSVQVLVDVPGSMAIAQMVSACLESQFSLKICAVSDKIRPDKNQLDQAELIVSTTNLSIQQCPVVIVNPMLDMEDYAHILTAINKLRAKRTKNIKNPDICLTNRLTPEMIVINTSALSWSDAIRCGGEKLIKNGHVTPAYVNAMVQSVENNGPYIVVAPHLALAHVNPEKGCLNPGISLVLSAEGTIFHSPDFDPVRMVFCVAEQSSDHYLDVFQCLAELAADHYMAGRLPKATTPAEVFGLLQQWEYKRCGLDPLLN